MVGKSQLRSSVVDSLEAEEDDEQWRSYMQEHPDAPLYHISSNPIIFK
jgi:hypothetical protein